MLRPIFATLLVAVLCSPQIHAEESLQKLLKSVEAAAQQDRATDQQRLQQFRSEQTHQAQLLEQAKARLARAEAEQQALKTQYDDNSQALKAQRQRLRERTAQLGEVFGVVREVGKSTAEALRNSLISAQYPERLQALDFAQQERVPSGQDLHALWYALQQEITETGAVVRFERAVSDRQGQRKPQSVYRVGPFVALDSEGRYLDYHPERQSLSVFRRQPSAAVRQRAQAFVNGDSHTLSVDPSRGHVLHLETLKPSLEERIHQGSYVGYIILGLGGLGLLLALFRLIGTLWVSMKVSAQLRRPQKPKANNPLGRLMLAARGARDTDDMALRVDEALMGEVPRLERGLTLLKLLAAVAPLLGLLGTVTGMIGTFQSITLFGNNDPKLMAGGISQALITTVLGLCAAIPLLFCHSFLAARTRRLLQLLQQKSLALLIEGQERASPEAEAEVRRVA